MKWSKRFFATAAAMVMMVSAAGCNNDGGASVEELITKAQNTMATVESMTAEMTMDMDISMEDETIKTTTKANIQTQQNPLKMQIDTVTQINMTELDNMEQKMQMFGEEKDGELIVYTNMEGNWFKQSMSLDGLQQYSAEENMKLYLDNISSFKKAGGDTINGKSTTKIEGVISGDAMKEAIVDSGIGSAAASFGVTEEDMEAVYSDMQDLPVALWIDEEGYVLKYELDMKDMMQKMMDYTMSTLAEQMGMEIKLDVTKTLIAMTCDNFNEVNEIAIPEEALNTTQIGLNLS